MATPNLNKAEFLKSAVSPSGFLTADLPCIVFAGKSNVGKSSVINRLLNRKNFARVGSQPGKTVHVNYFCIDGRAYCRPAGLWVRQRRQNGARTLGQAHGGFLRRPRAHHAGVMIVDARHKPTADDETMAAWFHSTGCPMVVVANKCDKLKSRRSSRTCAHPRHAFAAGRCGAPAVFGGEGHRPRGTARRGAIDEPGRRACIQSPQSAAGQSFAAVDWIRGGPCP